MCIFTSSISFAFPNTLNDTRYDAVKALGGTALLQTIYAYALEHQADIDTKCTHFDGLIVTNTCLQLHTDFVMGSIKAM